MWGVLFYTPIYEQWSEGQEEVQKNLEHTWKILIAVRYILNDAENYITWEGKEKGSVL